MEQLPVAITGNPFFRKYTLTLGLNTLINPYGDNYSLLVVGSFFSIIPIFILFVCFQQYFIEGMTAGAVKE